PVCRRLAADHGAVTYGTADDADVRAVEVESVRGSFRFGVVRHGEHLGTVELPLRGIHNVRNAVGALAMAMEVGVSFDDAASALARFGGVARRFDVRGVSGGATLVDDYAHLPSEIAAVLAAARVSGDGWRRVVAVFQPNRFNRMAVMWPDYADAFTEADVVVLTDIFASGTEPIPGVTGKLVVNAVLDAHPNTRLVWLPRRQDLVEFVAGELRDGVVCISMGCGDIASFPSEVIAARAARGVGSEETSP
ncbi:MAG: glutamate ligase domain-containing protein, partial [Actinomycetes bacterium]